MVNSLKIQTDMLKLLFKNKTNTIRFQETDDSVIVTLTATNFYIIPKRDFFIDLKKLEGKEIDFNKMIKTDDCVNGRITGTSYFLAKEKMTLVQIVSDDFEMWVDQKLIKDFGNIGFCKVSKPTYPVYLYDVDETLLGMVLPVRKGD